MPGLTMNLVQSNTQDLGKGRFQSRESGVLSDTFLNIERIQRCYYYLILIITSHNDFNCIFKMPSFSTCAVRAGSVYSFFFYLEL